MLSNGSKNWIARTLALLICVSMAGMLMAGCGSSTTSDATSPAKTDAQTRTITDMAGRTVEIPAQVNTVYCAVPTAEAMVYTLAPEKMAAWVNAPSEGMKPYLSDRAKALPVLGGWMGEKCTANLEEIAKLAPDVIIWMGYVDPKNIAGSVQTAESITEQTKRPVIIVNTAFASTPEVYRFMGDILGIPERAEKLAAYTEKQMKSISDMVAKIPEDKLVTVYYAEGTSGLATDPADSGHTEVLKFVKGINVADVEAKSGQGMSTVSMEQVLAWNPAVILVSSSTGGEKNYQYILSDASWAKIAAVQNKKVYITPLQPFGWFDRPPNIMRALGIVWLGNVLYPEYVNVDLNKETREFFKLFYNMDLTDEQVNELLKNAI